MLESLHKQAHRLDCQLTIIQIDAESIENELNDKRKDTTNVKRDDYDKMQELRKGSKTRKHAYPIPATTLSVIQGRAW